MIFVFDIILLMPNTISKSLCLHIAAYCDTLVIAFVEQWVQTSRSKASVSIYCFIECREYEVINANF